MENILIKKYVRLLQEASGIKTAKLPEVLLPAPKDEIRIEIEREAEKLDEINKQSELYKLIGTLEFFSSKGDSEFIAQIITLPCIISLAYTIWIVIHGASWYWILLAVLLLIGSGGGLIILTNIEKRNFIQSLLIELSRYVTLICYGAIWIRLVIYSGLFGVYTSTIKGFDLVNLLLSLFALFVGYFYSKAVNTMHYFVFSNAYKGFPRIKETTNHEGS